MTLSLTPTTELEAVNEMLKVIGESPATSLTGDVGDDVITAKSTLKNTTRSVLVEGWHCNTEHEYPLSRTVDNEINVPANTLKLKLSRYESADVDVVVRGTRLYDLKNHTYTFTSNLKVTLVVGLLFEELPEPARHYITYRACRKYQDENLGSDSLHRFTSNDEVYARAVFANDQYATDNLTMSSTPFISQIRSK